MIVAGFYQGDRWPIPRVVLGELHDTIVEYVVNADQCSEALIKHADARFDNVIFAPCHGFRLHETSPYMVRWVNDEVKERSDDSDAASLVTQVVDTHTLANRVVFLCCALGEPGGLEYIAENSRVDYVRLTGYKGYKVSDAESYKLYVERGCPINTRHAKNCKCCHATKRSLYWKR